MQIIPAILTDSRETLIKQLVTARPLGLMVQLDFADGQFVPSHTLPPEDLPPELLAMSWEAHLMTQDPQGWSRRLYAFRPARIYWHVETLAPGLKIPHRLSSIEHALAVSFETPLATIEPYLPMVDSVLLMSIARPGYQGEQFQPSVYERITQLKTKHPRLKITIDGGVKLEHLKPLVKLGVDRVAIGSGFWQYGDVKSVLGEFRKASLIEAKA